MKSITITEAGAQPQLSQVADPTPTAGQVLVRVQASSVNSLDTGIAAGMFAGMGMPHQYPVTLGRDVAGTVEAVGADVTDFAVGDAVFGEIPFVPPIENGTWAELVALDAGNLTHTPDGVDTAAAGAAALAVSTALPIVDALELHAGDTVLVVGATGGVGSVVVQLAAAAGATVLAPALAEDEEFLRGLGVSEILPRDGDVLAEVRTRHPEGVDAIVDAVTAYQPTAYAAALKDGGRVASPTNAAGEGPGRTNVMHNPDRAVLDRVAALLAQGSVRIPIQATYSLDQAVEGLGVFGGGHTQGKISITVS